MLLTGPNVGAVLNTSVPTWKCPTYNDGSWNFNSALPINLTDVAAMYAVVLTSAIEFDDSSNDVDFIPSGAGENVLSTASFADLIWETASVSNSQVVFTGVSDMMTVILTINPQATAGRESQPPAISFTDFSSVVSLEIQDYAYTSGSNWTSKLAVQMYMPAYLVGACRSCALAWHAHPLRPVGQRRVLQHHLH